jgi:dipeptidyl-peptidase-3
MAHRYLLEQVEDAAIVQYYADGFDQLTRDQKRLVWHLYSAALAGRDIYYDQRYARALDMRDVIEEVIVHVSGADVAHRESLAHVRRYAKLFWIHSGPHHHLTARKFVLACQPSDLLGLARLAESRGARFPLRDDEDVAACLRRLHDAFFDPTVDRMVTSKTPGPLDDILTASANNLYAGVRTADLHGFVERYGLNSRLVRSDGHLVEEVYRVGGKYGEPIGRIVGHLRAALPFAPPPTRQALERLIHFYETGEQDARIAYDIAWVADTDSPVDTINGFVETYLDPRGVKGAWEGIVCHVNTVKTRALQRLAEAAAWYEARMPWDPQWRRRDVVGVSARAIDVIVETGDAGPMTAIGINLPNDESIRERYGSKSVSLANITEAYDKSQPDAFRREFSWTDEEASRAEQWGTVAHEAATAIHEVLGHGSGRVADRLQGQPQLALKETYSTIEETRADLIALYFMTVPKTAEVGLVPLDHQADVVRAEYEAYARTALTQLCRVREGATLEEDHMRNRQLIVHWLRAHTQAVDRRVRDDKTFYVVVDVDGFREGVGRLLAEVQRIKSEGDYEGARTLVEAYGTHFDPALRDEIVGRVTALNLPSYTAFVQPRLQAMTDESGEIVDVHISYPCDLEQQMLEYSGRREAPRPAAETP